LAAAFFALAGLVVPSAAVVLLLVLSVAVVAVCLRDYRDLRQQLRGIKVHRRLPTLVGRNLPFRVEWTVEGSGQFVNRGDVRDVVPAVASPRFGLHRLDLLPTGGSQTIEETLRIPVRGLHRFGPVWVRLEGPLRFLEAQQAVECSGQVKVLPEQYASRDELLKDAGAEMVLLDKVTYSRQHGHGTEFESLHDYRYGDDPRRIDWRTTARLRRPIVRRYQIERHRDVMIFIDCGRLMGTETDRGSKLDCAVDSALLLGRVALQSGDRCGLGLFDDQVRGYLPPVTGAASMNALADCVYDAQVAWRESDFTPMFAALQRRQAKRSLIVVLSDVVDAETSEQFRASLLRLQKRHVVLFAALRTPALRRIVREPVETILDGARKAVTFRLLHERERALHSLHRGGIFVVDVEPTQLTAPLINQFIELRQRNLL
jgi:uncharacterized protein (DUF58 family)